MIPLLVNHTPHVAANERLSATEADRLQDSANAMYTASLQERLMEIFTMANGAAMAVVVWWCMMVWRGVAWRGVAKGGVVKGVAHTRALTCVISFDLLASSLLTPQAIWTTSRLAAHLTSRCRANRPTSARRSGRGWLRRPWRCERAAVAGPGRPVEVRAPGRSPPAIGIGLCAGVCSGRIFSRWRSLLERKSPLDFRRVRVGNK